MTEFPLLPERPPVVIRLSTARVAALLGRATALGLPFGLALLWLGAGPRPVAGLAALWLLPSLIAVGELCRGRPVLVLDHTGITLGTRVHVPWEDLTSFHLLTDFRRQPLDALCLLVRHGSRAATRRPFDPDPGYVDCSLTHERAEDVWRHLATAETAWRRARRLDRDIPTLLPAHTGRPPCPAA